MPFRESTSKASVLLLPSVHIHFTYRAIVLEITVGSLFLPAALPLLLSTAFKQARTIQNCMIHVLVRSSGTVELISEWPTVLIHFARAICEGLVVREAEVMSSYGTYLQWMYYCNLHGEPLVLLGLRISPSSSFYFWLILSEGGAKEDTPFFLGAKPFYLVLL